MVALSVEALPPCRVGDGGWLSYGEGRRPNVAPMFATTTQAIPNVASPTINALQPVREPPKVWRETGREAARWRSVDPRHGPNPS